MSLYTSAAEIVSLLLPFALHGQGEYLDLARICFDADTATLNDLYAAEDGAGSPEARRVVALAAAHELRCTLATCGKSGRLSSLGAATILGCLHGQLLSQARKADALALDDETGEHIKAPWLVSRLLAHPGANVWIKTHTLYVRHPTFATGPEVVHLRQLSPGRYEDRSGRVYQAVAGQLQPSGDRPVKDMRTHLVVA